MQSSCSLKRGGKWVGACLLALGMGGCAAIWDDLTNKDMKYTDVFRKQEPPLVVLRDSTDGAKRGRALTQLKEPLRHGGTQEEQDQYLALLGTAALKEKEPLCRLGAIKALGEYKDARAAKILEEVYLQKPSFTPEVNTIIRQQSLQALVQTGNPDSRHLLIRVARQPGGGNDASYADRQQTIDERLTALRGLAKFKEPETVDALVYILESEKDVALRNRAHESLKTITNKDFPAEAKPWRDFANNRQPSSNPNAVQPVSFWKRLFAGDDK